MNASANCQSCGSLLSANSADGLCPACMLRLALEADEDGAIEGVGPAAALPRTFGPYELLEEIGRGGMGVVYAAKQIALGRTVAVKLLLSGAYASEAAVRRFRLEAAAAAGLQHPGIVAIHDYGEHDGQPYYAMDLLPGRNLADLCAGRPLPARRAAEILRDLAGAVQYAHEKGVIHRDLKPSNVLVAENGQPCIADFGLAKRLDAEAGVTLTGQVLGSPSYASPEQAAGRAAEVGVASDIYGLGALLYHLVTGRAPFNAATPAETLRLVLDTEAAPPRLLNPSLPRDLETIGLTCMDKDPGRRYRTAAAVADDLGRFLSQRPIVARPPSAFYRMRKFTRRHRVGVVASAAVLAALVAGFTFALIGFRRAIEQKRMADTARGQAQALTGFLIRDLQPAMEDHGRLEGQKLAAEGAVRYFEQLPPALRDEATNRDYAAALETLANVYGRKPGGVTVAAENVARAHAVAQRSLALRRQLAAAHPDDCPAALAVVADEAQVAGNDPATPYRTDQAFLDQIGELRGLERRFAVDRGVQRALAAVLNEWAYEACFTFGRPADARAAATEARERWERLLAAAPGNEEVRIGFTRSLAVMAETLAGTDASVQASEWGEKALAAATRWLSTDPTNLRLLANAGETASRVAWLFQFSSLSRATEVERIARDYYRTLTIQDPATAEWRIRFAQTHDLELHALAAENRLAEARSLMQEAVTVLKTAAHDRETKHLLAASMRTAALLAKQAGDAAGFKDQLAALDEYARACTLGLPDDSWEQCSERLFWLIERGDVFLFLESLGDLTGVEHVAREALDEIDREMRRWPNHRSELLAHRIAAQGLLGVTLVWQQKHAEAVPVLRQAVAGLHDAQAVGSLSSPVRRDVLTIAFLAEALSKTGAAAEAMTVAESALSLAEAALAARPGDLELRETAVFAACWLVDVAFKTGTLKRNQEAYTIWRNHCRILMKRQPANPRWRYLFIQSYEWNWWGFTIEDTRIEPTLRLLRECEPGLELALKGRGFIAASEPFPRFAAISSLSDPEEVDRVRDGYRVVRALFAAAAGDAADVRTQLKAWRFLEEPGEVSSAGPVKRRDYIGINHALWSAWLESCVNDWPAAGRFAREAVDEAETAIREDPGNGDLTLDPTIARGYIGLALWHEGRTAEAVPMLREVCTALLTPRPVGMQYWTRLFLTEACAAWLAQSGEIAQARSLLAGWVSFDEIGITEWERGARIWLSWSALAREQVLLASLLDPANPAEAARRAGLLDRAARILEDPKAEGCLWVVDKEALARLNALQAADQKLRGR